MSLAQSFVRVYNGDPAAGGGFVGTAFFISAQQAITATHVVNGCDQGVYLCFPRALVNGQPHYTEKDRVHIPVDGIERCPKIYSWLPDVALVHCDAQDHVMTIPLAQRPPEHQDNVTLYGFLDVYQEVMPIKSNIGSRTQVHNAWNIGSGVKQGMSGGAVVRNGELLGVLYARDEADKIISYCIPIDLIQRWKPDLFADFP